MYMQIECGVWCAPRPHPQHLASRFSLPRERLRRAKSSPSHSGILIKFATAALSLRTSSFMQIHAPNENLRFVKTACPTARTKGRSFLPPSLSLWRDFYFSALCVHRKRVNNRKKGVAKSFLCTRPASNKAAESRQQLVVSEFAPKRRRLHSKRALAKN